MINNKKIINKFIDDFCKLSVDSSKLINKSLVDAILNNTDLIRLKRIDDEIREIKFNLIKENFNV